MISIEPTMHNRKHQRHHKNDDDRKFGCGKDRHDRDRDRDDRDRDNY